jgi:outer membrane protein
MADFRRLWMKTRLCGITFLALLCASSLLCERHLMAQTQGVVLENSPRLEDLIRGGKMELTLADALALVLENNLDIAVQRYVPEFARIDVMRTLSGQAARGFTGASIPGGLTAGALGAGVSGAGTGTGVGSAGGITGGGGAVSVGQSGAFDPSFSLNASYDKVTSPLNTIQVSGIPVVTGTTYAFSSNYAQQFHLGTSYFLALSGQRQQSDQQNLRFNPAVVTRFSLGMNQPLLNGFGLLPNERFIRVARSNTSVSEEVFRQQVINTVVLVENTYWDLAAFQENVRVAEQSLAVAERLYKDNQIRVDVGTMSPLDLVSAEAEVAARRRDLTVARTNLQLQEAALKNVLSKRVSPALDAAQIVLRDSLPEPRDADIPDLNAALAEALAKRPDLRTAVTNIQNQDIAVSFTKNSLKPDLAAFGFYAGSGLDGNNPSLPELFGEALSQSFGGDYPEYAGGFSFSLPIRNRQAQADNLRSRLEQNQLQVGLQRSRNQVALEVRKAIIGIIQGKAQVQAAHEAVRLAREILEGERNKLDAGASTSYQVILRERDLNSARLAEVSAMVSYVKALVELDRSRGTSLDRNTIELGDALSGLVSKMPIPPFAPGIPDKEVK